jgi:hypothetical protein
MRVLKLNFILLALVLFCTKLIAGPIKTEVRCYADGSSQKTKLEMKVFLDEDNNWLGGYVRYGKNKPPISIVWQSNKVLYETEGRPSTFETVWLEIGASEVTGKYTLVSQGANVYSFEYVGRKSNKVYKFDQTVIRDTNDEGCKW